MKWEALTRSQAVGGNPAASMSAFMDRLPTKCTQTQDHVRRISCPTSWPVKKRFFARSLVEWFENSGLTMAKRAVDPATLDKNYSDNRRLDTMAEDLRLHPCALYTEEDNQNLPLIRLTCTDGSFNVQPRGLYDLITAEETLNCIGTGAGGVVFLPPGYSEKKHVPQAVRIHSPTPLPGMNAFAWELVTQLIALHFTKYMPNHSLLTSDYTSAIARTNRERYPRPTISWQTSEVVFLPLEPISFPTRSAPGNSCTPEDTQRRTRRGERILPSETRQSVWRTQWRIGLVLNSASVPFPCTGTTYF
jgi:hypothetical protein